MLRRCALLVAVALHLAAASAPSWLEVDIGIIGPASEDVLGAALSQAQAEGASGLLVRLDTPGGALENTRAMVKTIMSAPMPVVVWVGPAGSRAGSAGAFITMAAHVAAMAPGTNIGAAHPVDVSGKDGDDNEEMKRKIENDTIAFIESIATKRGRNVDMARSFVATSTSITDAEAIEHKVVDLVAKDVATLMAQLDGRIVELESGAKITLATKDIALKPFERSLRQKLLELLSNPNLFYLLFMAGLVGLGYELTHPGMILPGVVGAICLILALIATSVLPISYGAAALLLAGIGMMVAEVFVASFGVLGVGGFVAFVLGSIFLVDPANEAGMRISGYVIAPGAATIAAIAGFLGWLVLRSDRSPVRSGRQSLVGETGTVVQSFGDGLGAVKVGGTVWRARLTPESGGSACEGERVKIAAVDNLELVVTRIPTTR